MSIFSKRRQCSHTVSFSCLVPRRLSFDENVRAKEGGKEDNGRDFKARLRPPSLPFPWSLVVHHQSLVSRSPPPREKLSARGGGWSFSESW